MTAIPPNQITPNDIAEWVRLKAQLDSVKASEMLMRKRIFGAFFPDPREGSNNFVLPDERKLTATHVIDRQIDPAALQVYGKKWQDEKNPLAAMGSTLIKWEPKLVIKPYRELTDENRKEFDNVLTIKPGSPQLKLTEAKAKE